MTVTSPAFADQERIPVKHTGFGEDRSPELRIAGIPEGTATLAVVMEDLDVPLTARFTHWIAWNIPRGEVIPEGLPRGERIASPVSACQGIAWGKHGYRGPKPPFMIRNEHRYVFTVYALDGELQIPAGSDKKALTAAMNGHALAEATLTGRYRRP